MKPQTCCRCESVHAAVPAVAENPLELRRLLPAPGGLCATGSEIPATVPKLAFPRTLLPSRESMHPSPRLKRSGLRQSFDVAAKCKHPEVHTVHGTRDSSHSCSGHIYNNPGCNTAGPLEMAVIPLPWLLPPSAPPWATVMAVAWVLPGCFSSSYLMSPTWLLPP